MSLLVLRAFYNLIRFDFYLWRNDFHGLHATVRTYPVAHRHHTLDLNRICHASDLACIWYWKQVLCLQRSAVTTCLLKDFGMPAQMVIGAQPLPFKAHAWVEVEGRVVNDKPYVHEIYAVLDRC